jgi:hypothetical protein
MGDECLCTYTRHYDTEKLKDVYEGNVLAALAFLLPWKPYFQHVFSHYVIALFFLPTNMGTGNTKYPDKYIILVCMHNYMSQLHYKILRGSVA